jgi:glucokinase
VSTKAAPALALDIGGTKLAVGVVGHDGVVSGMIVEPTHREEGPDRVIERLFAMGRRSIVASGLSQSEIVGVGISCGGPLDSNAGVLLTPLHLPGWVDVPVASMAASAFDVPAILVNDATAGACGEYRFGAGRGADSILYLTISTGMGGGAVLNGKLHHGAAGNGGEFGHIMVHDGGRACTCGRFGCVEAYAAGSAIAARAREFIAAGRPSVLSNLVEITSADVAAFAAIDDVAAQVWSEGMAALATAATDLVNIFEPNVLVLGGGVTRSGDILLEPVKTAVKRDALPPAAAAVEVVLARLGDAVCVVGAGAYALDFLRTGTEEGLYA